MPDKIAYGTDRSRVDTRKKHTWQHGGLRGSVVVTDMRAEGARIFRDTPDFREAQNFGDRYGLPIFTRIPRLYVRNTHRFASVKLFGE